MECALLLVTQALRSISMGSVKPALLLVRHVRPLFPIV